MSSSEQPVLRQASTSVRPLFESLSGLPVIDIPQEHLDENHIIGFDTRDSRCRPFNLMRTQLLKRMRAHNWRMIGVTSATPGAGKTFTSVNLAAALSASAHGPVLLCDLDLRLGSIQKLLEIDPARGLVDYLKGDTESPRDCVYRFNQSQMAIVPTTSSRRNSGELLATERFDLFMKKLRALPDDVTIICDLPPVFADDDAMICIQYLDAFLLVVDHGVTTARQLEETMELLSPVPCAGAVLNRYKGGFADPYGYGYGDTYGLKDYG